MPNASATDPASGHASTGDDAQSPRRLYTLAPFALAILLSATLIAIAYPTLGTLTWEYDEGTYIVQARSVARGLRPFIDFVYHQPPLHLHLLALAGKVFGDTVFGYRMLSLVSISASGLLLFWLTRPFVGPVAALLAQAIFLFSPSQLHALNAVAEPPMVLFSLLGIALLFVGTGRLSAYASGVAFVIALLIKPTCLVVVVAAVLSLVYARSWKRLADLAVSGLVAASIGLSWVLFQSNGVFADILRFQVERFGARNVDGFDIFARESGLGELMSKLGIATRQQWAVYSLEQFCLLSQTYLSVAFLAAAFAGVPIWIRQCARSRPALGAFAVLWPAFYWLANFVALDFASAKYFVPFLAFTSFLLAGLLRLATRHFPRVAAVAGIAACIALAIGFASILDRNGAHAYYEGVGRITRQHPAIVSFSPMLFAATNTEPGCGFGDPANTYESFGARILGGSERLRRFWFPDTRLIECLKSEPGTVVVADFWFYALTRRGSSLRTYLSGEGSAQRVFLDPGDREQLEQAFGPQ